ncbi:MAG: M3 family metallopeptidase [Proteobacteria bacterium]|nr:M3 family metallopeptidase [Pseudomonadota bacterium]
MNDLNTSLYQRLPRFDKIVLSEIPAKLDACLAEARNQIAHLLDQTEQEFDSSIVEKMNDVEEAIDHLWSPITHLNGVADTPELREIFPDCLAMVSAFYTELGQNRALFDRYVALHNHPEFETLNIERKRVITNAIRNFQHAGVDLNDNAREEFRALQAKLSDLGNQFERNLLDATESWHRDITDKQLLAGLPQSAIDLGRQAAKTANVDGWRFGLQMPSYLPIIRYADNRELRKQFYTAYSTRASELQNKGQYDNAPVISEILQARQALAQLHTRPHYADYALTTKMASNANEVIAFLSELCAAAKPVAEQEIADLIAFAADNGGPAKLEAWDLAYYSEKLREQKFSFSVEQVREYFAADTVVNGLFEVVNKLFGISARVAHAPSVWNSSDVTFYELLDKNEQVIGGFYTDLFARQGKRGGAWMDTCLARRMRNNELEVPVAYLTCNFTPPLDDTPAQLTHDEVETLFHEFGHCLHHLLTQVLEPDVGGINGVAWDAVELPSQFLEHWCWEREALNLIAKHYQTDHPIPDELVAKMRAAKTFQSGMQTLRQIEFAMFDMQIHTSYDANSEDTVQSILDTVRSEVAVYQTPSFNRFQNSFSHIFAGGYAAGYYSYKWAEVLSSDAFGRFEEEGVFNQDTGADFRQTILARGGSEDAAVLFKRFRGRLPDIAALLRHTGLTSDSIASQN